MNFNINLTIKNINNTDKKYDIISYSCPRVNFFIHPLPVTDFIINDCNIEKTLTLIDENSYCGIDVFSWKSDIKPNILIDKNTFEIKEFIVGDFSDQLKTQILLKSSDSYNITISF